MSDIKMSDVFNLPIKSHEPPVFDDRRTAYPVISASVDGESIKGIFAKVIISKGQHSGTSRYLDVELAEQMASSICEALNNHDRLVEENAQLKDNQKKLQIELGEQDFKIMSLKADKAELLIALSDLTNHYCELVNSGDAGNWDPHEEAVIKRCADLTQKHKEPTNGN